MFMRLVLVFSLLFSIFFSSSSAQTCAKYSFPRNQIFSSCNDLPHLNSFVHWNYEKSSGNLQIAYRQTGVAASTWSAWAINPTGSGMVGAQALVAYQLSNGTMRVYTSQITAYKTNMEEGKLKFDVSNLEATHANSETIIYATLALPNDSSSTSINQVWQIGPVSNGNPGAHSFAPANTNAMGTLNLLSAQTAKTPGGRSSSRSRDKNIHGVLNVVSWGILMPLGVIIARYLRVFKSADPAWFYLHITCQTSAYIIGVSGWATGLKLGNDSAGVQYTKHRTLGILLFILATLQVFALLLRPNKDHKYRFCWNIYHHLVGYSVILLSIINIYFGFEILMPEKKWKNAYIGIIVFLVLNAVWLEAYTWYVVLKRRRSQSAEKTLQGVNGGNGANGYGSRTPRYV